MHLNIYSFNLHTLYVCDEVESISDKEKKTLYYHTQTYQIIIFRYFQVYSLKLMAIYDTLWHLKYFQ